ncbi:MAG TPA: M20/M25/M40 family metallo-hydrolase [Gemmatimonadales bacterium]|nr:M20/M25/M40 family metallo-hydrolase [Gemmatimonadales bacterium]
MIRLRPVLALPILLITFAVAPLAAQTRSAPRDYRAVADSLIRAATGDSAAYRRLGDLVDRFGHRLAGSPSLEAAIDWILAEMRKDGLSNVRGEPVMVTSWVRGQESVNLVSPRRMPLRMLGLGGSVSTPPDGITARVLVVSSFDELERRRAEARGRIVLFDAPFTEYGETRRYRTDGAVAAARAGAVASLIRSVAPFSIRSPHTGRVSYQADAARIPAAALSNEDAMMLHRMQDRGDSVVVTLRMQAHQLPDAQSRNVVAEVVGRIEPDEVVVLGGHIDSWDVGQGAMDDGGGSVAAWEAVRLIRKLGLHPRRTIRVVLWTNEENGVEGGAAYLERHRDSLTSHVMAMESDGGVFNPRGVLVAGTPQAVEVVRQVGQLLRPIGADRVTKVDSSPEADIEPMVTLGVPGVGLDVDASRYFWYHHSDGDTLDKLDPAEMGRCVALMAVMAYVIADLPVRLPS